MRQRYAVSSLEIIPVPRDCPRSQRGHLHEAALPKFVE